MMQNIGMEVSDGAGRRLRLTFTPDALEVTRILPPSSSTASDGADSECCLKHLFHYRMIYQLQTQRQQRALVISSRDFRRLSICFDHSQLMESFTSRLNEHIRSHIVHAFSYRPPRPFQKNGWNMHDALADFDRIIGQRSEWRVSSVNESYSVCPTYPKIIAVPSKISDTVIYHAAKFRSRGRLPALTYLHSNGASITRCSQPMVGLKSKRSIQDEKLIEAIFESSTDNIIVDARPLVNAVSNRALGAGTESLENYKQCQRLFMGIENIHVMRDSLYRLYDAVLAYPDPGMDRWLSSVDSSSWVKHLKCIMEATVMIIQTILAGGNVLIHCSDGWDRTAQLSSLASICLDPYYRTLRGFISLVEKEWLAFGHKFSERCGHIYHGGKEEKETAPVFHQFLECTSHLLSQYPDQFEFNERLLIELYHHHYSCRFGTFLKNNEQERWQAELSRKTQSFWSYVLENPVDYTRWLSRPPEGTVIPSSHPKWLMSFPELWFQFDDDVWGGPLESDPLAARDPHDNEDEKQMGGALVRNFYRRRGACNPETVLAEMEDEVGCMEDELRQTEYLIAYYTKKLPDTKESDDNESTATENHHRQSQLSRQIFPPPRQLKCAVSRVSFGSSDQQLICRHCKRRIHRDRCRHQTSLVVCCVESERASACDTLNGSPVTAIDTGISVRTCDDCLQRIAS